MSGRKEIVAILPSNKTTLVYQKTRIRQISSLSSVILVGELLEKHTFSVDDLFGAPGVPKNGRNGPIWAIDRKNRIGGCDSTEISVVLSLGIIRIDA